MTRSFLQSAIDSTRRQADDSSWRLALVFLHFGPSATVQLLHVSSFYSGRNDVFSSMRAADLVTVVAILSMMIVQFKVVTDSIVRKTQGKIRKRETGK